MSGLMFSGHQMTAFSILDSRQVTVAHHSNNLE